MVDSPARRPCVDDAELVRASRAGDRQAFGDLVLRHQRSLRLALAWHVDDPELIDELVQDSFVSAFERLDQFDAQQPFFPWLRQIGLNRLRAWFRSQAVRRRHRPGLAWHLHREALEADAGPDEDLLVALRRCLDGLTDPARSLLQERYRDQSSLDDLAQRRERSVASLKAHLFRLRRHLRRCIGARLQEDGA